MLNSGDQNSAERLHAVSAAWQAAPTPRGSSRDALPGARDADHYLVHKGEPDLAKALATATAADHIRHLARSTRWAAATSTWCGRSPTQKRSGICRAGTGLRIPSTTEGTALFFQQALPHSVQRADFRCRLCRRARPRCRLSKSRAAAISNSPGSSSRGGKSSGSSQSKKSSGRGSGGNTAQKKAAGRKGGKASSSSS
jgi:hypothetical protein